MDNFKNLYPQIISLLQENLLANPDDQASRMLLAVAYERVGEVQLAISTYREALSRTPDDVRIIIPTVAALYKAKEYEQADEILNRASRTKLYHPQLQKLQVHSYLRHGQLSSASEILQKLINNDPNNQDACFSLALLRTQQNKLVEAEKLLTNLKNQEPNSLPITYAQIQLNIRQNKPEKALSLCNEIVNNLNNASAYILRARTYTTLEQVDKAIQDLEHATSIEPNNVDVWVARSQFYRSIGQPDMAITDIQKALSLASNNIQIQKHAISLLLASGNSKSIQQGRTILGKALESNPEDIELRLFKAHSLLAEGTAPAIEDAEQILQTITKDQPKFSDSWLLLAEIALGQGQSAKAIDIALRGLAHRPNDKSLLLLKAQAEAESSPVLAIPTLKALRELEPNDVDIVIHLANTYLAVNQPQKAINILKTQLTSCSDTTDKRRINTILAIALHKNGDKAASQKEFEFLLQSDPDDTGCLLAQARLLKDDQLWDQLNQKVTDWYQKHPKDSQTPITIARELTEIEYEMAKKTAKDILQTILENDPNCTKAMNSLAILLQIAGHFDESAMLYQKILAIEPDNVIAINNLAWIMCEEQSKHKQALELAEKGLTLAPNYVDLIDTRGVAYYRLGEFNKAIQDFTTCIKLYPNTAPPSIASRFHLGRAYAELGKRDSAIEQLNQVLDLENQIGGLSKTDLAEVKHLIEELSQGG
jgi:tetratricopeptide (TPR) repeat protein